MASQWRRLSQSSPRTCCSTNGATDTSDSSRITSRHKRSDGCTISGLRHIQLTSYYQFCHSNRHSVASAASHMSPEGLSLWKTWEITGAKDGWRQQLLVPRCKFVPGAHLLISAWLGSASALHTREHTRHFRVYKKTRPARFT